jgi:hypothetical protein
MPHVCDAVAEIRTVVLSLYSHRAAHASKSNGERILAQRELPPFGQTTRRPDPAQQVAYATGLPRQVSIRTAPDPIRPFPSILRASLHFPLRAFSLCLRDLLPPQNSPIPPSPIHQSTTSNRNGGEVRCRRGRSGHRPPPQAREVWLGRGAGCRGKRPFISDSPDVLFRIRFA